MVASRAEYVAHQEARSEGQQLTIRLLHGSQNISLLGLIPCSPCEAVNPPKSFLLVSHKFHPPYGVPHEKGVSRDWIKPVMVVSFPTQR